MTVGMIYISLLTIGLVYAVIAAFFGWLGDHDVGGVHVDASGHLDAGQPHPISGTILATFITGFGAGGTIVHYHLAWDLLPGLLVASISGAVLAGAAFGVLEFLFSRTQAGSEFRVTDAVGRVAEVITPIAAGGIGEIAYTVKGQRERAAARSADATAIPKGRTVTIERLVANTAYVRLKD